jgi:CBS domain-containing protein
MESVILGCSRSSTLLEIEELLSTHDVSRVVVLEDTGGPVGIVSEKDILRFLLTDNSTRRLEEVCASEVMTPRLITINPQAPISEAAEVMIRESISSLAVTSDRLDGIVTKSDIANYLALTSRRTHSVAEFMTCNPITVNPSHSLLSTVQLMSQRKISRVVVVDEDQDQEPKGIVTLADFTLLLLSFVSERMPANDLLKRTEAVGLTVEDLMTRHPLTINENSNLVEAARLMMKHHISGLPVVDESSKLKGIVSKTDVTRAVASQIGNDIDKRR